MQISFYVLSDRFLQSDTDSSDHNITSEFGSEAVLNFVCKLTETVLNKNEHYLVIIDDNTQRQQKLNSQLWSFSTTSFIPHNLFLQGALTSDSETSQVKDAAMLSAPVTLTSTLPEGFDGVVLNLASDPLPLSEINCLPKKVLEIIAPDDNSKQQGREKYAHYRKQGFELVYHPIN